MRVLVTGGAGRLGAEVCRQLAPTHEVVVLDRRRPPDGYEFIQADLTDAAVVRAAILGCDAVAHMGAIPGEIRDSEAVFSSNMIGTFNVLQGMAAAGVGRIVFASSIRAYGAADLPPKPFEPQYIPVDEEHPLRPATLYGFTKQAGEQMCERYHRSHGITGAALRFPQIVCDEKYDRPDDRWAHRILWAYVDNRDAARSVCLALEMESAGFDILNVTAADSHVDCPFLDRIAEHYPQLTDIRDIEGFRAGRPTTFSIAKAESLLGYRPQYSFTMYLER